MEKRFKKILYDINDIGNLQMVFVCEDSINENIYFDGGNFSLISSIDCCDKYWKEQKILDSIIDVKQTEDFDYIIKLGSNNFMKIYYTPDNFYINGVVQTFRIIDNKIPFYEDVLEDFNLSSSIDFLGALGSSKSPDFEE